MVESGTVRAEFQEPNRMTLALNGDIWVEMDMFAGIKS